MKNKKTLFKELLNTLNRNDISEEYKYIGTGNPLSDILIIGKEVACSINSEQYRKEILSNICYWKNLKKFDFNNVKSSRLDEYEPLYPYKGQFLRKDNGENWGTSVTWMNYQKLINKIYSKEGNINIDFHEKSFITEVNSTPSKKTIEANTSSIGFRKEQILKSDFINSFKVIVISGVGYFKISDEINEIEEIFKVKFIRKEYANKLKKTQPYWFHINEDKTKILINTYQLSIGISDQLLKEIANEISKFLSNEKEQPIQKT